MSSSETDSHLARWLPRLDQYRDAINAVPHDAQNSATASIETIGPILPAEQQPVALPKSNIAHLPIAHLPIDGIVKRIQRSKSFVLGIGSIGLSDPRLVRSILIELVSRCSTRIDKKAILVTLGQSDPDLEGVQAENCNFQRAFWTFFGKSKADLKAWHAQLGALPRWKQEFGLIVMDLGDVSSQEMPKIGRLCDGVVLQIFNSIGSQETIRALKSFQKENLHVLGAWSVGLDTRKSVA